MRPAQSPLSADNPGERRTEASPAPQGRADTLEEMLWHLGAVADKLEGIVEGVKDGPTAVRFACAVLCLARLRKERPIGPSRTFLAAQ